MKSTKTLILNSTTILLEQPTSVFAEIDIGSTVNGRVFIDHELEFYLKNSCISIEEEITCMLDKHRWCK